MKAVLVDTGPLVALLDGRDRLHRRAAHEARQIRAPALVGIPVLTEVLHLVRDPGLRRRLEAAFERGPLQLVSDSGIALVVAALAWLEHFADHRPDFADAHLVSWAASDRDLSVWTFDREFSTVWRTSSGEPVRLFSPGR